jgi:hypothetical protein
MASSSDAVAARDEQLAALIAGIDKQIAEFVPVLGDLTTEALIATGIRGEGNQGQQRIGQLLDIRKAYVAERAALPVAVEVNIEAGTDIYGTNLDES